MMMRPSGFSISARAVTILIGFGLAGCGASFPCGDGQPCLPGTFCKLEAGSCDDAAAAGVCTGIPEICTLEYSPVCGCDGVTYSNPCSADAAGVNVAQEGVCDEKTCGGLAGRPCGEGEFCKLDVGECCCDFQGVCTPIPNVCTEIFNPVCGCDGVTYSNSCFAEAAGVSIDRPDGCSDRG